MVQPLKVAVIGAGPAGLTTARELQREGHEVVVYEKANQIGGAWLYDPRVEDDPLGLDPNRQIIHCSLTYSLRTNIPRCLMGFSDYPFPDKKDAKESNFPGHAEVLKFLRGFTKDFGLDELIRFNTEVLRVEQVNPRDDLRWLVESKKLDSENSSMELFDAVVICSGHNSQPKVVQLPGVENWPGKQIHSHNYRHPEPFKDQKSIPEEEGTKPPRKAEITPNRKSAALHPFISPFFLDIMAARGKEKAPMSRFVRSTHSTSLGPQQRQESQSQRSASFIPGSLRHQSNHSTSSGPSHLQRTQPTTGMRDVEVQTDSANTQEGGNSHSESEEPTTPVSSAALTAAPPLWVEDGHFMPADLPATHAISRLIKTKYEEFWPTWKDVPQYNKDRW